MTMQMKASIKRANEVADESIPMRMVVKIAGALLDDAETVRSVARQIAQLAQQGHELLVVHGGGKIFTATLARMGIESRFVNGLRVTDRETRDIAVMVMGGLLNKRMAGAISAEGQPAIGLCASDARCFLAEPMMHDEIVGSLGFVGYLTGVNVEFIESMWRAGIVPVASCLGLGADGELYNINADHMAAACAEYLHADRLMYMTDVAGVLDGTKVLKAVSSAEIEDLIRQNKVSGGHDSEAGGVQARAFGGREPGAHRGRHYRDAACFPLQTVKKVRERRVTPRLSRHGSRSEDAEREPRQTQTALNKA